MNFPMIWKRWLSAFFPRRGARCCRGKIGGSPVDIRCDVWWMEGSWSGPNCLGTTIRIRWRSWSTAVLRKRADGFFHGGYLRGSARLRSRCGCWWREGQGRRQLPVWGKSILWQNPEYGLHWMWRRRNMHWPAPSIMRMGIISISESLSARLSASTVLFPPMITGAMQDRQMPISLLWRKRSGIRRRNLPAGSCIRSMWEEGHLHPWTKSGWAVWWIWSIIICLCQRRQNLP